MTPPSMPRTSSRRARAPQRRGPTSGMSCGDRSGLSVHRCNVNKNSLRLENMPARRYGQGDGARGAEGPGRRDPLSRCTASWPPRPRRSPPRTSPTRSACTPTPCGCTSSGCGRPASSTSRRSTAARSVDPSTCYSLAPGAPGLGFDPPAHALLAGLLAAMAEQMGADADAATATGRAWGRRGRRSAPRAGRAWTPWPRSSPASASSPPPTEAAARRHHPHRFPALPVPGAGRGLPRAGVQPAPGICAKASWTRRAEEASCSSRRCTSRIRATSWSR